jgi:co-chaperonin GroES (HSP10)
MSLSSEALRKFILIGDRVLIRPKSSTGQTKSGLFLPPGIEEKEEIQTGIILKTGPGFPLPGDDTDEPWKEGSPVKFLPLQVKEGDTAIYLQKRSWELEFNRKKYVIVPQNAILMVIRENL